jgi:predicted Zn-dependent peptidase
MVVSFSGDADNIGLRPIFGSITSSPSNRTEGNISFGNLTPAPTQTVQMNTPAPWILIGYRIDREMNASNRDLAALRVLTAALAETAPSLLSQKLLDPQGKNQDALAEQVSGQFSIRRDGSELMVAVQSDAAHLAASRAAVLQVINDLKTKPLTVAQLQAAITYAEGDWASTRDSSIIRAVLAGYANVQGIFPDNQWPEQLKAVTTLDVQNAAKKYLNEYAVVTVDAMND